MTEQLPVKTINSPQWGDKNASRRVLKCARAEITKKERLNKLEECRKCPQAASSLFTNQWSLAFLLNGLAMSLIHALVAKGTTVLAEHKAGGRDFSQATQTILSKIPPNNSKLTYAWEQYQFHYISEDGYTYLVMADDSVGRRTSFAFLADLQRKFTAAPSSSSSSSQDEIPAYSLQGSFGPTISALLQTYNTAPPSDELARAQNELNQVKDIMVQNVEQILSRGERIELLVDKTDVMAGQATAFRRGARSVRRQMWWKNSKMIALSVVVALFLLWLLMAQFCGAGLNHCSSQT